MATNIELLNSSFIEGLEKLANTMKDQLFLIRVLTDPVAAQKLDNDLAKLKTTAQQIADLGEPKYLCLIDPLKKQIGLALEAAKTIRKEGRSLEIAPEDVPPVEVAEASYRLGLKFSKNSSEFGEYFEGWSAIEKEYIPYAGMKWADALEELRKNPAAVARIRAAVHKLDRKYGYSEDPDMQICMQFLHDKIDTLM